jgi:acyl-CoA synthetase (AMP-forming)/AMP-acid ligase II
MTTSISTLDLSSATLLDSLRDLSRVRERGVTFYDGRGRAHRVSYAELWARSLRFAEGLRRAGMRAGDTLVLVLPAPEEAIVAILGSMAAGCAPAPVYPPISTQAVPAFLRFLGHVATRARARLVVAGSQVYPFLGSVPRDVPGVRAVHRFASLLTAPIGEAVRALPDDVAFLQFTSGSTSAPKGVAVTHRCLVANLWMIRTASRMDEQSAVVTWLPVYHDMGLIGTVLNAITMQIELAVMSPRSFLRDPGLWLRAIATHRGTHTAAPNFAYGLCAKRIAEPETLDLSTMRVFICGAEPIVPETLERFVTHFAPAGLDPGAMVPAYGLAEATLAVTFMPYGTGLRTEEVDAGALSEDRLAQPCVNGAKRLRVPSCGMAMPLLEVGIREPDTGLRIPERSVGEVVVKGPSVTPGYIHDPDATRASRTHDGWLRTGDLGYLAGGHLYACGRLKDVIILRGRNLHAHDVEAIAGSIPDVRTGNVVAFGAAGANEERLVVVAEAREPDNANLIAREIRGRVGDALGIVPDDVVIVPPGTLPKTSSGKLRRIETRARWESGNLAPERGKRLETLGIAIRSGLSFVVNRVRAD